MVDQNEELWTDSLLPVCHTSWDIVPALHHMFSGNREDVRAKYLHPPVLLSFESCCHVGSVFLQNTSSSVKLLSTRPRLNGGGQDIPTSLLMAACDAYNFGTESACTAIVQHCHTWEKQSWWSKHWGLISSSLELNRCLTGTYVRDIGDFVKKHDVCYCWFCWTSSDDA